MSRDTVCPFNVTLTGVVVAVVSSVPSGLKVSTVGAGCVAGGTIDGSL